MFRQDRTNPSTAISNWRGRHDTPKAWPSTAVSSWLNGGLFGGPTGAGLIMGGAGGYLDTVDRFSFPSDARTTLGTGLSSARHSGAGMSNSGVAGYAAGGGTTGNTPQTTVDKFAYADDARSTLGTGLADTRTNQPFGFSNSGTAGYIGGGWSSTGSAAIDKVDKFAFSNDARSTLSDTLVAAVSYIAGMANSGTAGYATGGLASANLSRVEKLPFSTDTFSTLGTGLATAVRLPSAMANSGTAGYVGGGYASAMIDDVDKFAFSDDSRSTLGTGLSNNNQAGVGMANTGVAGYFAGGVGLGSAIDKYAFADDSRSSTTTLSGSRSYMSAAANEGALA